ncbi:MAG: L-seryl-tRNA(Sec) selenium transferase [Planctomycetota bacterium]|jgi:L-seryl-tRNA(Ser) seleniumtransferase
MSGRRTRSRDDRQAGADGGGPAAALRALPAVDRLLRELSALLGPQGEARHGQAAARVAREELDALRAHVLAGTAPDPLPDAAALAERVASRLSRTGPATYPRVVNATGVLLHTGLGRSALPPAAAEALAEIATGYTVLEVDPETGERKHREARLLDDLRALFGAESGTVVNNNAGALLLSLAALATGREVLVSRGELIEIGGGFRLPDLMRLSGARLVEVGTTNRTYAKDFDAAVTADTALILSVHTSNYRVVGFQHGPGREELVEVARRHGVPLLEDLGSGLPGPPPATAGALVEEPDVRSALAAGVDLVCFSGDKLLGGPQAGILAGRADLVATCRGHQLFRALRPDRLALAALAGTLATWRRDPSLVPMAAALAVSPAARLERARALALRLGAAFPHAEVGAVASEAQAGSGSLPARTLRSAAVEIAWPGLPAAECARRLRTGQPPVFPHVFRDHLRLDVLAMLPGDDERIEQALAALPSDGTPRP